eukprot:12727825-Alexandrium_andersonii.AAC.1
MRRASPRTRMPSRATRTPSRAGTKRRPLRRQQLSPPLRGGRPPSAPATAPGARPMPPRWPGVAVGGPPTSLPAGEAGPQALGRPG